MQEKLKKEKKSQNFQKAPLPDCRQIMLSNGHARASKVQTFRQRCENFPPLYSKLGTRELGMRQKARLVCGV